MENNEILEQNAECENEEANLSEEFGGTNLDTVDSTDTGMTMGQMALAVAGAALIGGATAYVGKRIAKAACDFVSDWRAGRKLRKEAKKTEKEAKVEVVNLDENGEEC